MSAGRDPAGLDVTEPAAADVLAAVVREHGSRLASALVWLVGVGGARLWSSCVRSQRRCLRRREYRRVAKGLPRS